MTDGQTDRQTDGQTLADSEDCTYAKHHTVIIPHIASLYQSMQTKLGTEVNNRNINQLTINKTQRYGNGK